MLLLYHVISFRVDIDSFCIDLTFKSGSRTMPILRFHKKHGENIKLLDDDMVSFRENSFSYGISFSAKPLRPKEIFLIEIERNEGGWSGHLRIGLTMVNPTAWGNQSLPQYALPDLVQDGTAWISAVTKSHNKVADHESGTSSLLGDGDYVLTYNGMLHKSVLRPDIKRTRSDISPALRTFGSRRSSSDAGREGEGDILPTDVGSRIGVVYVIRNNRAELHFLINGEDQGPCAKDIPCDGRDLYVVVDVYGTTKQVRIIQLYPGENHDFSCLFCCIVPFCCMKGISGKPMRSFTCCLFAQASLLFDRI